MNNSLPSLAGHQADYRPASDQPTPAPADVSLVNLNEVVQHHLLSRGPQVQALQAIVRFDALPHVLAAHQDAAILVSHLFNSILDNPPPGTKLFIYIRCERENSEVMDLTLPEGFQSFTISVYTNIVADEAWMLQQQPAIAEMQTRAAGLQGSFAHFSIVKTGCLFQLVLPGKLL